MRCKKCGWPNKPNEKVCVKCHTPLVIDNGNDYVVPGGDYFTEKNGLNKTVMEEEVFGSSAGMQSCSASQPNVHEDETATCPKCGYPVRPGTDKCPNCKFALIPGAAQSRYAGNGTRERGSQEPSDRRPTRMNNGGETHSYRGTINPYMVNMELEPTFRLQPLKRINERHDFEELEYEGKEVILTRENTEPKNSSITSKQQSGITRVDGHWFIEDKSEQRTTFVQAAHKVELHDGDIILLGNRLFEFHE